MVSKLLIILFVTIIALLAQNAAAQSSASCGLSVAVTYIDDTPAASCSYECDQDGSGWYSGVMYERSEELEIGYDSMVQIEFADGAISSCTVVPYVSIVDLTAEDDAVKSCLATETATSVVIDSTYFATTPDIETTEAGTVVDSTEAPVETTAAVQFTSVNQCSISIDIQYPIVEGEAPTISYCDQQCSESSQMFVMAAAYSRFADLESYGLMVKVKYTHGEFDSCSLVPYASDEDQSAAIEQCLTGGINLVNQVIPNTSGPETTTTVLEPTIDNSPSTTSQEPISTTTTRPELTSSSITTPEPLSTTTTTTTPEPITTTTIITPEPTTTTTTTSTTRPEPITTTTTTPEPTTTITTPEPTTTTTTPEHTTTTTTTPEPTTTTSTTTTTTTTTTTPEPIPDYCSGGFSTVGDYCFMITSEQFTRDGAQSFCEQNGGSLAVISSQKQQDSLTGILDRNVWIQYNDQETEGTFVPDSGFNNWNDGEPNNINNEDCTEIDTAGGWNDLSCSQSRYALCEKAPQQPSQVAYCPEGQTLFRDSCYFLTGSASNYDGGRQSCADSGATPVFINDQEEQDFIASTYSETAYIGLDDRALEGTFVSPSYGVPIFSAWGSDEPNNVNDEDCATVWEETGMLWNDASCDLQYITICEAAAIVPTACPEGFQKFEESACFRVTESSGLIGDGDSQCASLGASFTVPKSAEEQAFLEGVLQQSTLIASRRVNRNTMADFARLDGIAFSFQGWASPEPNDLNGEDCVEMNEGYNYQWNDLDCGIARPFLCRTDPAPVTT